MIRHKRGFQPKQRDLIAEKQNWTCCYCGRGLLKADALKANGKPHPRAATVEHLRRRCEGGTNHPDNKAVACLECNRGRGSVDWLTYKSIKMGEIFA